MILPVIGDIYDDDDDVETDLSHHLAKHRSSRAEV
jgi:hypothetical protein